MKESKLASNALSTSFAGVSPQKAGRAEDLGEGYRIGAAGTKMFLLLRESTPDKTGGMILKRVPDTAAEVPIEAAP